MRKPAIGAAIAVFALSTAAQAPMQCTNADIVNGLILMGRSDLKMMVSRADSGLMGGFRAPRGFTLIGSGTRASMSSVAYKTSLPTHEAHAALITALGASGWKDEPTPGAGATFNVAGSPRDSTLCREGERRSLLVREAGGTTYATLLSSPQSSPRACNEPDPAMGAPLGMRPDVMPHFEFPAGTGRGQGGGGSGSNQSFTTSSRIISTRTPTQLVEHLAGQIREQGWRADAGWSGATSAGSTWHKTVDGVPRTGTLDIVVVSDDTHDVTFTLSSAQ